MNIKEKVVNITNRNKNSYEMKKSKEKTRAVIKNIKRKYKELKKSGVLKKIVVLISALALIATSVLPYIL
jgi:hypothetical protein